MIQEILEAASNVKDPDTIIIKSNQLKNNEATLTEALSILRYLLFDMAIDLGMGKDMPYEEIGARLSQEVFCRN